MFYSTLELGFWYTFSYILLFNPGSNPVKYLRSLKILESQSDCFEENNTHEITRMLHEEVKSESVSHSIVSNSLFFTT